MVTRNGYRAFSPSQPASHGKTNRVMSSDAGDEVYALKRSLGAFAGMGVAGVVFSWWAESDAILLDGVYSFVLCLMSLLGVRVAKLVHRGDTESHPFGYSAYEPSLNMVKGLIVLAVCLMAAFSAVEALLHGGRDMAFGIGLIYSAGVTSACAWIALRLRSEARQTGSPLLKVEARNWTVDAVLSGGIGCAFLLGFILERAGMHSLVPYVDPVLTVILVSLIFPMPLRTVREGIRELLYMAPPPEEVEEIKQKVRDSFQDYPFQEFRLRVVRSGRSTFVLIHLLIPEEAPPIDVADDDRLRERLHQAVAAGNPYAWVELVVTKDPRWAPGLDSACS